MSCLIVGVITAITTALIVVLPKDDEALPGYKSPATAPPVPKTTSAPLTTGINSIEDYVYQDDGMFSYEKLTEGVPEYNNFYGAEVTLYTMTSQKWLTEADSNRHVWTHTVAFIRPVAGSAHPNKAVLWVTGSIANDAVIPADDNTDLLSAYAMAIEAKTIVTVLFNIPAAPITFTSDGVERREDAITAYTWDKYGRDESGTITAEWLIEFPMTKAAVRCIDLMEIVLPTLRNGVKLSSVTVSGASKRGWTSWLVGAAEAARPNKKPSRVNAIIPIVMDLINVEAFLGRMYKAYGGFSYIFSPYMEFQITKMLGAGIDKIFRMNDPWYYKARLTMPKYIISTSGDEFMLPDNTRYLAPDLPGETKMLMLKNGNHFLAGVTNPLIKSLGAFVISVQDEQTRPDITWTIDESTGAVTVDTDGVAPTTINVIYGDSLADGGRRDFRMNVSPLTCGTPNAYYGCASNGAVWADSTTITGLSGANFVVTKPTDAASGTVGSYRAFTVELTFAVNEKKSVVYTVPVSIAPNTWKESEVCVGAACPVTLV